MSGIRILLNDSRGIYIPQSFADYYAEDWSNINSKDLEIISNGPENDFYWDAWNDITSSAEHVDENGNVWNLYQDGDLFAICYDLMDDEEYYNFFGEERAA